MSLTFLAVYLEKDDPFYSTRIMPVLQRPCRRLGAFQHAARIGDVCHKPATKLTIEQDISLAEKLNPARDEWQQIYQLLKAQKNRHLEG